MKDWEAARDVKALDYLSDLEDSSYDFMARDVWFRNGAKADLLKYRHENREFKILGVYEPSNERNASGEEMIEAMRQIGDLLLSEGFTYEISSMRSDNIRDVEVYELEGDYYFDTDLENTIMAEIEDLFAVPDIYDGLSLVRGK